MNYIVRYTLKNTGVKLLAPVFRTEKCFNVLL